MEIIKKYWFLGFLILCLILACLVDVLYPPKGISEIKDQSQVSDENSIEGIESNTSEESNISGVINYSNIKGMWLSQFDMQPVYVKNGKQRSEAEYTKLVEQIIINLKKDNFNTVYLQLRPNGDSMYESEFFPVSRYISGAYGKGLEYDALKIFVGLAHDSRISVHGWINPLRLIKPEEMKLIDDNFSIKKWFSGNKGQVVKVGDRLYLNPAFPEVRQLIIDGAYEAIKKYKLDGIHMDDYFYPTTDKSFDEKDFLKSGYNDLEEFRCNNINLLVKGLFEAVKRADESALYGIAPAGNIYSLKKGYYADVYLWCSQKGYIDYIMPQLYFGFLNKSCPFDKVLDDWTKAVTEPSVKLIVGLTAAKAVLAQSGELDVFAGTQEGKTEWINYKDILSRSLKEIYSNNETSGYCFFCYQYFYNPVTGEANEAFSQEKENIGDLFTYGK